MPRKNALALMQTGVIAVPRAEAPCELTGEQADEWRAIVNTMPAEHFMRGNFPLLAQLCRHVVTARRIAQLLELEAERSRASELFFNLMRIQQAESKTINVLSRSMRLTQKSVMPPRTTHPVNRHRNPWEPEPEDEEAA
jgi:hypothetical protein